MGDPGVPGDASLSTVESRCRFCQILMDLGVLFGPTLGSFPGFFSRFASSISKYEPQGADVRRKLFGNSLFAELAPLSGRLLVFEVSGWALGSLWDTLAHILVSFGDPGCTFSDFWGSWR